MRVQGWHVAISLRLLIIFSVLGLPQTMIAQVTGAKPAATTPAEATQQNLNPGDDRVIINTDLIYPPEPDRAAALAAADPERPPEARN